MINRANGMSTEYVIYEQPLNELVRVSLRIERLLQQLDACEAIDNPQFKTASILHLIIELLNILDRPDIKSKLTKEFIRFLAYFSRLENHADISKETLDDIRKKIDYLLTHFLNTPGKIGQSLRQNEFLLSLKQSLMSPGGDSCCDAPAFHFWLQQTDKIREKDLQKWLQHFDEIRTAIELLLSIIRHSEEPVEKIAEKGFYHLPLNPHQPIQLIRVAIPTKETLFPEISAGRHRMSVRFVIPDYDNRPKQTPNDIPFQLTLCRI